jgi:hypothetical protein
MARQLSALAYAAPLARESRLVQRAKAHPALAAFWLVGFAIMAFHVYAFAKDPSVRVMSAGVISAAALIPAYLWCRRPASFGLPIFPLFAMTFVVKYAFALAGDDEMITIYSDEEGMYAGLTVAFFLLVGTAAWYWIQGYVPRARGSIRAMRPGRGDYLFIAIIVCGTLFNLSMVGQWVYLEGWTSVIRAAALGLSSVGIFVLSYRAGSGELSIPKKVLFATALILFLISHSMSLLLIDVMAASAFGIAAYVIGGGKLPWKIAIILIPLFAILHQGKEEMRDEYWERDAYKPVQLYDYPEFVTKWVKYGIEELRQPAGETKSWTLSQRLTLVPLLLKVQAETPEKYPYMNGETYAVIPQLLVPRIFNPNKLTAHEGSHRLSIYYGLQTREATETSTIAWGPLIESYANFGLLGVVGLAIVIGMVDGAVAKAAAGVPILSLRMLMAIVFTALALQVEWTAGVYVSALFQATVIIWATSFVLMQRRPLRQFQLGNR